MGRNGRPFSSDNYLIEIYRAIPLASSSSNYLTVRPAKDKWIDTRIFFTKKFMRFDQPDFCLKNSDHRAHFINWFIHLFFFDSLSVTMSCSRYLKGLSCHCFVLDRKGVWNILTVNGGQGYFTESFRIFISPQICVLWSWPISIAAGWMLLELTQIVCDLIQRADDARYDYLYKICGVSHRTVWSTTSRC